MKVYLGIDPGKSGALAIVDSDGGLVEATDYPGDVCAAASIVRDWRTVHGASIERAAIELVHSMPGQGVKSMFSFGENYGAWQGILAALFIPFILVKPQQWQKGVIRPGDGADAKARSLAVARRMFPDAELSRKKDHGKADALLLADYARRWANGNS